MTLALATDGCCAGHLCDNCPTCRKGRCCRRDNPDYRLPELGEWDGPVYGELGVLPSDGEKVQCHACGKWYKHVGVHTWLTHNLTADEHKAIFGLHLSRGILAPEQAVKLRARHTPHLQALRQSGQFVPGSLRFTPEQRAAYTRRGLNMATQYKPGPTQQGHSYGRSRSSHYMGVWHEQNRWRSQIQKGSIRYRLGIFDTEEAAARAYDMKARELYGDKARLNFPEDV